MKCMISIMLAAVTIVLFSPHSLNAQSGPVVWVASSLQRVGPTDAAGTGLTADISAAKNESESFQIVVQGPATGLSNVNISLSDLQGPGGQVISEREMLTLERPV